MKVVALVCGILASAFAWAASRFLLQLDAEFLTLWAPSNSQQLFGTATWYAAVAAAAVGGVLALFSPLVGGIVLLAVAGGWATIGTMLPSGFSLQVLAPIALSVVGAMAAFGALFRGRARKRAAKQRPSLEDMAREEALRLEPTDELTRAVEVRNERIDADIAAAVEAEPRPSSEPIRIAKPPQEPAGPPRGLSGLFVANVAVLLLLTGAVSLLLYSGLRSGQLAAAFAPAAASARPAPVANPAAAPVAVAPAPDLAAAVAAPADTASPTAAVETAAVAAPAAEQWTDPFAYCAAVGTVDFPDGRYAGPTLVAAIADALRVPQSSSPDRAKWRCYQGAVWACASFGGPKCAMTPSVTEMLEFCARNPGATGLMAPNGGWSCNGTEPQVPPGESWPMDARGFLPGAWIEVSPGPAATAG